MEHKTRVGKLLFITPDEFWFELEDGEFLRLVHVGNLYEVPTNIKIALCMTEALDGRFVVCTHKPFYTEIK